ncbi:hypothetical protein [Umezawaea beigongshangensis]|nr:hypothetical protein [Umezawaea beigongshangensis]
MLVECDRLIGSARDRADEGRHKIATDEVAALRRAEPVEPEFTRS